MVRMAEKSDAHILMRVESECLQPIRLRQESPEQRRFAARVSVLRPLCIQTALQYPGLLSIDDPQKACAECALKQSCGSGCVHTLGALDVGADDEYVVMHLQDYRNTTPDEEKADLQHLLKEVTGHPVALKQQSVAC